MILRKYGFSMLVLLALLPIRAHTTPLEEAGYSTIATFDLSPVMDMAAVGVATDPAGNVYVLGQTRTGVPGAYRLGVGGGVDLVVVKFSSQGQVVHTTLLGGDADEDPGKIFVDSQGHVFITGWSGSTNFPLRNALQSTGSVYVTSFLCRIAPDGASLVYSTFIGGEDLPSTAVAIHPNGEAILAGARVTSSSEGFNYDYDAAVVRLGEFGSNVVFSTALGGMSLDYVTAVALDPSGAVWVAGRTSSPDFPVAPDAAQSYLKLPEGSGYISESDAFLVKLGNAGTILYSTFWGTEGDDGISTIAFRNDGAMFVARSISPRSPPQLIYQGGSDHPFEPTLPEVSYESRAFITLLNPHTGQVISEAALPVAGYNIVQSMAIDSNGNAHFSGYLAGNDYLAQFDPAQAIFPRFAVFDNCSYYTRIGGPVIGLTGDFWITRSRLAGVASVLESALDKLAPSLPPPANRRPMVAVQPYGFGAVANPGIRGFDSEPPRITPVAADTDGTVQQVQLFTGETLLAVLTDSPYTFVWSNAPYGEHTLRAVVTDNLGLSATSCTSSITVPAPPANDSFYRSIAISGATFTVSGTTAGATLEPGETDRSFGYDAYSVWWCWRAPSNGTFSITLTDGADSHSLTVYAGLDLTRLQSLGGGRRTVAFQAVAGRAYYIRVSGYGGDDYILSLQPAVPPPNDNFSDRLLISGVPLTIQGHNFNATFEPGLNLQGGDDYASVWWTWTAPTAGMYRFSTVSTNLSSAWLRVVPTNTSGFPPPLPSFGTGTSVVARAAAAESFHIRVSGIENQFTLQVTAVPPPPNDNMADAILLAGLPVSVTGSLMGATGETNEPSHSTYGGAAISSVWYRWTAPIQGPVHLEVDSDGGAVLAVYRAYSGDLALETQTAGSDAPGRLYAFAGQEYWIAVDASWSGTDHFTLTLRSPNRPPNDNLDQRILVTEAGFGSNAEASFELIELDFLADDETETVWYSWFAPVDGDYTLVTHSAGYSGRAAVFRLGDLGNLVQVAGRSNVNSRLLQFSASGGIEYQIAFISRQNEGGELAFRIRPSNAPANDDYADAAPLVGANVYVEGSNIDATIESGELAPTTDTLGASVWWKWTAPHSGLYVVSLARHSMSAGVEVYRGSDLSNRVHVVPIYALSGSLLIDATVGEEYRMGVYGVSSIYGWFEQQGEFTLAITAIQPPPNDDFASATVIQGSPVSVTGTTLGATAEGSETAPSVWWSWTAPASQLTTVQMSLDRPLEVFTGVSLATLTRITGSSNWYGPASLAFEAQAGVTYHIRVSQHAFATFTLTLKGPATLERPMISSPWRIPGNSIQFTLDARIGTTNIIEASSDLLNWSPISTNLTDCFPYLFTAPPSTQTHQFYRARLVQ